MPRFRRTEFVTLRFGETHTVDFGELLRGRLQLSRSNGAYARSALTGDETALDRDDLGRLADLPIDEWIDGGEDARELSRLAQRGLVLTDNDDPDAAALRELDARFAAAGWHPEAVAFHLATRWRDVDVAAFRQDADLARVDEEARRFIEEHGQPPAHFHELDRALDVRELPLEEPASGRFDALMRRKTTRAFDAAAMLSTEDLSTLLRYTFGCHGTAPLAGDARVLKKTSPSGGSLHPLEAYPLLLGVEGLDTGLYHYRVRDHALELLEALDVATARSLGSTFVCGQAYLADAQALLVVTARFPRTLWKYRRHERAYTTILLDAGHMSQSLYLAATELGLGAFVTAAINGANIDDRLGLDPVEEGALLVFGCGVPLAGATDLEPDFAPYVPRETTI